MFNKVSLRTDGYRYTRTEDTEIYFSQEELSAIMKITSFIACHVEVHFMEGEKKKERVEYGRWRVSLLILEEGH